MKNDKLINRQVKYIAILVAIIGFVISVKNSNMHLPGNFKYYEPKQPISFSHQLHAGEMEISCLYCHFGAEDSKHAGIPPANICMNCHKYVSNSSNSIKLAEKEKLKLRVSAEIQKLYSAFESAKLGAENQKNIEWVKVHNLPDYVYFSHKPHVNAGVACTNCHGDVESMNQIKQEKDLSMGWCLECHRDDHQSLNNSQKRKSQLLDCATCHY